LTMGEQMTRMELRKVATYLRRVYPGVAEQDELWNLIAKIEQLAKGPNAKSSRRRGDTPPST
jgi:hypothetical protein